MRLIKPVSTPPKPTSTYEDAPEADSRSTLWENLTALTRWRARWSRTVEADSGRASTLQIKGTRGSQNATLSRYAENCSNASPIRGLWKAPEVGRREKRPPRAAHASSARPMAPTDPETTI